MRLVLLALGSIASWCVAILIVSECHGPGQFSESLLALLICLTPAIATLSFVEWVGRNAPTVLPPAIMAGIGIRMFTVVAATFVLGSRIAAAGGDRERFAVWVVSLYLVILVIESGLLISLVRNSSARSVS